MNKREEMIKKDNVSKKIWVRIFSKRRHEKTEGNPGDFLEYVVFEGRSLRDDKAKTLFKSDSKSELQIWMDLNGFQIDHGDMWRYMSLKKRGIYLIKFTK